MGAGARGNARPAYGGSDGNRVPGELHFARRVLFSFAIAAAAAAAWPRLSPRPRPAWWLAWAARLPVSPRRANRLGTGELAAGDNKIVP